MKECDPKDIALKSFFLGPQSENSVWVEDEISKILSHWFNWRKSLLPEDGKAISEENINSSSFQQSKNKVAEKLQYLMDLYETEVPKFTPRYIGHMVSEVSLPAIFGHFLTLLHNPNNISGEVSKVGSVLESQAISMLSDMVGYKESIGHFTSGGTIANFEGIWRARYCLDYWLAMGACLKLNKETDKSLFDLAHMGWDQFQQNKKLVRDESEVRQFSQVVGNRFEAISKIEKVFDTSYRGFVILVPGNKHYSWQKGLSIFGFGSEAFWTVDLDEKGKLCTLDLKKKIELARSKDRPILMVVSVAGTTELGEIDPVDKVQDLLDDYANQEDLHFWHHVDAAYGGFYCSMLDTSTEQQVLSTESQNALKAIRRANSVTLDPHKLGYVPYACGAFLSKDKENYEVTSFAAPYLAADTTSSSKWMSTIEGSRSASGAAATWLTGESVGFDNNGYGRILSKGIESRIHLEKLITEQIPECQILPYADTNILCFCVTSEGESTSSISERSNQIYQLSAEEKGFSISKTSLGFKNYGKFVSDYISTWSGEIDSEHITLCRVVLMNPFFSSKEMKADLSEEFISWLKLTIKKIK